MTQKAARDVGLAAGVVVTGNQVDAMDDAALAHQAEKAAIFARVSLEQRSRAILALKARGHVVGYVRNTIQMVQGQRNVAFLTYFYDMLLALVPLVVLAPSYFAGNVESVRSPRQAPRS